jgi:hypothetical protein
MNYGMLAGFCLSVGFGIGGIIILALVISADIHDWRQRKRARLGDGNGR